jgi:hypothetical protein
MTFDALSMAVVAMAIDLMLPSQGPMGAWRQHQLGSLALKKRDA